MVQVLPEEPNLIESSRDAAFVFADVKRSWIAARRRCGPVKLVQIKPNQNAT